MDPRYPTGKFDPPQTTDDAKIDGWLNTIEGLPAQMRRFIEPLGDDQLNTPYRDGGWTVRQVVHHVPDSHLNSYVRFKLALTEDRPTIRGYHEDRWAELGDSATVPVEVSLRLLEALHQRWIGLLRGLERNDLDREMIHPENGSWPLWRHLALYAWHGNHHLGQIEGLAKREGWGA